VLALGQPTCGVKDQAEKEGKMEESERWERSEFGPRLHPCSLVLSDAASTDVCV